MNDARCHYCKGGGPDDARRFGLRELRPYGPGGAMVCYECANVPERRAETEAAMGALIDAATAVGGGVATIGTEDGPRPGFNPGEPRESS